MKSGIYYIVNIVNGKSYVGSSKSLRKRWYRHRFDLRYNKHNNAHLQSAWNSYGEKSFSFVILEYCIEACLLEREDWWMELLDSRNPDEGYNYQLADRPKMSEDTKTKLSLAMKGRPKSPEAIEKMIVTRRTLYGNGWGCQLKGKKHTKESRENMSKAQRGRVISEEHRDRLSIAHKGISFSPERKEAIARGVKASWLARKGISNDP